MHNTKNNLSDTLHRIDSLNEENKDQGLLNTIKVPRNLGQITERLPKPTYESKLKRNISEPHRIGNIV